MSRVSLSSLFGDFILHQEDVDESEDQASPHLLGDQGRVRDTREVGLASRKFNLEDHFEKKGGMSSFFSVLASSSLLYTSMRG